MRERPIVLKPWEVRAILDNRKTRLTRIVKHEGGPVHQRREGGAWYRLHDGLWYWGRGSVSGTWSPMGYGVRCPWDLGDKLWGRETFAPRYFDDGRPGYRADWTATAADVCREPKWTPSTHMPRWASRILLEVTEVRVQRVQDITTQEAMQEGAFRSDYGDRPGWSVRTTQRSGECLGSARMAIANAWNATHGADAWERNDWVWVANVKRVEVDRG